MAGEADGPGDEMDDDGAIPRPLQHEALDALITNSPFTRSLGPPDSLILTGMARFEQDVVATLLDTKTMRSQVVSTTPNHQGWQLIDVGGDPENAQTWRARVQFPGGEIVSIRYEKPPPRSKAAVSGGSGGGGSSGGNAPPLSAAQIDEARQAAVNYREGFTSDGYPNQPPKEMVEKLSRLSVGQREDINRQMIEHRNRGLGMEDRRKIYEGLVERAARSGR